MLRTRECTGCGAPIGPELYGDCSRCNFAVLCEPCASRHYCSPAVCPEFGCTPGMCIKLVEHGVVPDRRLGVEGARARWGVEMTG